MTTEDKTIQYWDSCLFISYLTNKDPSRVNVVEALLKFAAIGKIQIVTSTLTMVEVRPYADQYETHHMDAVEDLFHSNRPYFRPVALTGTIARRAREIGEKNRRILYNSDCVHIATAQIEQASVLFTYDGESVPGMKRAPTGLIALNGKIGNPPLRIMEPYEPRGPMYDPA